MNRKWMAAAWIVALAATLVVGCGPKKEPPVEPPPPVEAKPEMAEEVTPPVQPPTEEDDVDLVDMEITEINKELANLARDGVIVLDVYFDYDKYELKPDARTGLQKNAAFMRANPKLVFALEGHCDERGTNEYNLALGERRANAARDYLTSLGVAGGSMRTVSYGEERPDCTEHHEGCWSRNRRAHFVVVGTG